jgi:predicted outer membrane protein
MANLVEDIVTLESEADSIVAQARTAAKEVEASGVAEVEAYRQKLEEETHQKVLIFQKETEEKHQRLAAELEKDLAKTLNDIDQIPVDTLKHQIDRIVTRLSEQ